MVVYRLQKSCKETFGFLCKDEKVGTRQCPVGCEVLWQGILGVFERSVCCETAFAAIAQGTEITGGLRVPVGIGVLIKLKTTGSSQRKKIVQFVNDLVTMKKKKCKGCGQRKREMPKRKPDCQ